MRTGVIIVRPMHPLLCSFMASVSATQQTQTSVLRSEVAALRHEAQEAKDSFHRQQQEQEDARLQEAAADADEIQDAAAQAKSATPPPPVALAASPPPPTHEEEREEQETPPPPLPSVVNDSARAKQEKQETPFPPSPVVVDDSATWRRRYEHLAGLLAKQTNQKRGKVSSEKTRGGGGAIGVSTMA